MNTEETNSGLSVRQDFVVGMDIGGTKVHAMDTVSTNLHRFEVKEYKEIYEMFDEYFTKTGVRPKHVTIAMAGLRNDETGEVHPTNSRWPSFKPQDANKRYPGTVFETTNDMVAGAAGMVSASSIDLKLLKPGNSMTKGNKVVITVSTGVNTCTAAWDAQSKRHVFVEAESGHIGFQPRNEAQQRHLDHLSRNYPNPSIELALSGKHGVEAWIDHSPELDDAPELQKAIKRARDAGRPVGAVLLEFAEEGKGPSQKAAHQILNHMGTLIGHILADYALTFKATGGIYLIGSVALALGEYWAEQTDFAKSFVRAGTDEHAPWLESFLDSVPVYLITNPNIAVAGALALAKRNSML
jgi:glucokinase